MMKSATRFEPFRGSSLQDQISRLLQEGFDSNSEQASLTTWAPAVDIFENEHELVVKADLPEVKPEDLDIRVENNVLTIRGERKFEKKENENNYLRVERVYGAFSRSFALANTVNAEAIKADYRNGVLELHIPKREEAKPKQIKVNVSSHGSGSQASGVQPTPAAAAAAGR